MIQNNRPEPDPDLDRAALELYRSLSPESRERVNAFLQELSASAYIPVPFPDSPC